MKNFFTKLGAINAKEYFLFYVLLNGLFLYLLYGVIADPIAYVGNSPKTIKFYYIATTIGYFLSPLYEYAKIYIIAKILQKGIDAHLKIKSDFKIFFLIVLSAQFCMFLPDLIKTIWLLFVETDWQMYDKKDFIPLSLFSLFDKTTLKHTYYSPLKLVSITEVLYWIVLVFGISTILNTSRKKSFFIVLKTYGLLIFSIVAIKFLFGAFIFGL